MLNNLTPIPAPCVCLSSQPLKIGAVPCRAASRYTLVWLYRLIARMCLKLAQWLYWRDDGVQIGVVALQAALRMVRANEFNPNRGDCLYRLILVIGVLG